MTFIVLEGPDGAGKSRLQRALADDLRRRLLDPVELREPGSTALGEHLRGLLLDPAVGHLDPLTEAFLFSAGRSEMVRTRIRPALASGRTVLLDRWWYSTLAYQGGGGGVSADLLQRISRAAVDGLEPDLVLLLDIEPAVASRRRGRADRMESHGADYQKRVREAYLALAAQDPGRVRVIEASKAFPDVLA
jgi:dTMP kinase